MAWRSDRREFVTGIVASAFVGSTSAQSSAPNDFSQRYLQLLERISASHPTLIRDARVITIAANARPWIDTGINLAVGDHVSLFASGKVYLNRAATLFLLPRVVLWGQIGHADVFRPGSDTYSFDAATSGNLRLATLQGRWATRSGEHPNLDAYDRVEGQLEVLAIRWANVTAEEGIGRIAALSDDDPLIRSELDRLKAQNRLPAEFEPLWFVGSGANFSASEFEGEQGVAVRSDQNGGIIKAPIDLPLERGVTLEWDWRVNQLPATRAEDATPFHQYVSVALEFDDGQDLTWYWSSALEPGHHYRCPFPTWPGETHLVIRSGLDQLSEWVTERRDVTADVAIALQQTPRRITGLWLIATTAFGHQPASVDLKRIAIIDATGNRRAFLAQ